MPWRAATAATAASMTLSTDAGVGQRALVQVRPGAPPRTLVPSRVPSATSTVTCLAQPSPSSQVFLTRSAMAAGPLARRAEHRAQLVVDRVGKHWAVRLVGAGQLGHLRPQPGQVGLGGAVDGAQVQLGAQVHQQLVAPRRRAVGDGLDGVQRLDLVDAHLGRQRDQRQGGVGGVEPDVVGARSTRRRGRRGSRGAAAAAGAGRVGAAGAGGLVASGSGSGSVSVANSTAASRSALSTSTVLWAYSGSLRVLVARPGDGRRGLHADLDEPLHAETARGLLDEQQVLGLDPAHRAGELPRQQLDEDRARQLARPLADARCRSRRGSRRAARRAPGRGSPG